MRRRTPTTLGCLGALLMSCVGSAFGLYQWDRQTSLTAEAPAEVLRIFQEGTRQGGNYRYTVDYRYAVGGQTYQSSFIKRGCNKGPTDIRPDFTVGQPAKVCYNPQRPSVSEPFPTDYRCPNSRLPKFLRSAATRGH